MILPLEKQVSSLEPSKKLKELGVKQESAFYWVDVPKVRWILSRERSHSNNFYECAAFTVAELGEMLPIGCSSFHINQDWKHYDKKNPWECDYCLIEGGEPELCTAATEADARAKILIYLIEQGIVKP